MTKNHLYVSGAVLVVLVVAAFMLMKTDTALAPRGETATYENADLGLSFVYRTGATGYEVSESMPMAVDPSLVRFISLRPAGAGMPPEAGEGPAQITISVYKNLKNEWSGQWAESHAQYSNIGLKRGEVADTVVGGANGVTYERDGLYQGTVVVVAHGGFVYVFDGAYADAASPIREDFSSLIESVAFIPFPLEGPGAPVSGKLDINAICEGALAYMTFVSGSEADTFVADCKAGKHPEVIEKYKADNNLGDGRAI